MARPLQVEPLHLHPPAPPEWLVGDWSLRLQMLLDQPFLLVRCVLSSIFVLVASRRNALLGTATYLQVLRCSDGMLHIISSPLA